MLFWTFIFLMFYLYTMFKGNIFAEKMKEMSNIAIELAELDESSENIFLERKKKELAKRALLLLGLTVVPAIIITIGEIIYFTSAISLDPYKYPSIFMLAFLVGTFVYAKVSTKKADLKTEEGRAIALETANKLKRYSWRGFFVGFTKLVYFAYMFWYLSFPF